MEIGDRVMRTTVDGVIKIGVIVDKYQSTPDGNRNFVWQYSVKWEGSEEIDSGYMKVGLEKKE